MMPLVVSMLVPGSASDAVLLKKSTSIGALVGEKNLKEPKTAQLASMMKRESFAVVCGVPGRICRVVHPAPTKLRPETS